MIDKNTVLSVYTDKQTLLEYLTKIETALDKAVLTSSQLVYEGANNYHFKFVFEDGSSIETPSITLVQPISKVDFVANGNSVHFVFTLMDGETITTQPINLLKPVMAAAVRDGILYLTLSDGTEVSAGSITASFGATTFNGDVIVHGNFSQTDGEAVFGGNAEIDGNLQVNGNQTETGNLTVDGYIKQSKFELDTDIPISFSSGFTMAGFSKQYAHARVSNGKLNIVLCIKCVHPAEAVYGIITSGSNSLSLPSEVLTKLFPIVGTCLATMSKSCGVVFDDQGNVSDTEQKSVVAFISKSSEGIYWSLINNEVIDNSSTKNYFWRFEFNFLLSEEIKQ